MAKTMDVAEARNLLNMAKHEGMLTFNASTYRRAVESVAVVLRPRFEAGELDEAEWRVLEVECRRLFIRRPTLALLVTEHSPSKKICPFNWERDPEVPLAECAKTQMAADVRALAKRKGWIR